MESWFEIFRTGRHTATSGATKTWTREDLDAIASSYDPQVHEAPITLDHAKSGPAFGWIEALKSEGEKLLAKAKDVSEDLRELVRSGHFKKRSAEIYPDFQGSGEPYLRAVSFLGAAVPAVKGLREVSFSVKTGEAEQYEFADRASGNDRPDKEDFHMDFKERFEQSQRELDQARMDLEEKERALTHAEQESDDLRRKTRKQEIETFCEGLTRDGHFAPAWKEAGIVEFMESLNDEKELSFSEGKKANRLEWFKGFLTGLPKVVKFEEIAGREEDPGKSGKSDDFSDEGDKIAATVND